MAKNDHGRDLTGEEMATMLDEFSNGADKKELEVFANYVTTRMHRTLQQKVMGLFVSCIEKWGDNYEKNRSKFFDPRNEATGKLASKLLECTGDKYDRQLPYI